jgi:hypothetical protein
MKNYKELFTPWISFCFNCDPHLLGVFRGRIREEERKISEMRNEEGFHHNFHVPMMSILYLMLYKCTVYSLKKGKRV